MQYPRGFPEKLRGSRVTVFRPRLKIKLLAILINYNLHAYFIAHFITWIFKLTNYINFHRILAVSRPAYLVLDKRIRRHISRGTTRWCAASPQRFPAVWKLGGPRILPHMKRVMQIRVDSTEAVLYHLWWSSGTAIRWNLCSGGNFLSFPETQNV